jgi:hypothetical protein
MRDEAWVASGLTLAGFGPRLHATMTAGQAA